MVQKNLPIPLKACNRNRNSNRNAPYFFTPVIEISHLSLGLDWQKDPSFGHILPVPSLCIPGAKLTDNIMFVEEGDIFSRGEYLKMIMACHLSQWEISLLFSANQPLKLPLLWQRQDKTFYCTTFYEMVFMR